MKRSTIILQILLGAAIAVGASALEPGELIRQAETAIAENRHDDAIALFEQAGQKPLEAKVAIRAADYLLAINDLDSASSWLERGVSAHPGNAELSELAAVLTLAEGRFDQAAKLLRSSWQQGRSRSSWLERPQLAAALGHESFIELLLDSDPLEGLTELPIENARRRLAVLAEHPQPAFAEELLIILDSATDAELLRLGLHALREEPGAIEELLTASAPQARRAAANEAWRLADTSLLPALRELLTLETDPNTWDLAEALIVVLEASELDPSAATERLSSLNVRNTHRHLALHALADLHRAAGDSELAEHAQQQALKHQVTIDEPEANTALDDYWGCMERTDLDEMRLLLEHHRTVERLDARPYGLPERDFEDQKSLSIAERIFLRQRAADFGTPLPTSGPMQYHRESRNILRGIARNQGKSVDCSGFATTASQAGPKLFTDTNEQKLEEDGDADNEVNIAVNPFDPSTVVATSNPSGSSGNRVYRSSNWGSTWNLGTATVASNCCDPVSAWNRTNVNGSSEDVLYHSTLVYAGAGVRTRMIYSTNDGASWSDCGNNIGTGDRDRQDHAIDTNPASSCYNTIYVGHHNGNQYVAASTGTSFPYCQGFKESNTGIGSTIGSAMVVSTNGRAHNFFTQYGSPGGVYQTTTSNCGDSWGSSQKIASIKSVGAFEWGIPSTCSRQVYRYPQAEADRHDQSAFLNNIYVVWNDLSGNCSAPGCSGNTTCNNDIYISIGTPNNRQNPSSWSWSTRNLTAPMTDDYTDEFYPSLSVDPADGSIYVSYYRSGSGAGSITPRKTQVHYVVTRSIDGGASFEVPHQVSDQPTNESGSGANSAMQWGDYAWNDVAQGVAYAAWTDRREGADEDIWAAKICSEPASWSERAPSFSAPATRATASGNGFTVNWDAPNIYWGDGGQNPSARKYQLMVDGSVVQSNISETVTQTSWTPADSNGHNLAIRAVNQCGLASTYASVSVNGGGGGGGGGGGNTSPTVSISSPSSGSTITEGQSLSFTASATDAEDGNIASSISWSSNRDGSLGSGASTSRVLSLGQHAITASVTDSGGASDSDQITVTVETAGGGGCTAGFAENFDGSTSGWTFGGLWHKTSNSSCVSPSASSGDGAAYFGINSSCTYDDGATVAGNLVSPAFEVPADASLSFKYWRQVEQIAGFDVDSTAVAIRPVGGTWNTLWSLDSDDASSSSWTASSAISMASYAGQQVQVRFRFDSVDEIDNSYIGWLIDDVAVSGTGDCSSGALQSGRVALNTSWKRVEFSSPITDPVVVAGPPGFAGAQPAVIRIRNLDSSGFELKLAEWQYLDGGHTTESVHWLATQRGSHDLGGGASLEAGSLQHAGAWPAAWSSVAFQSSFSAIPVVLSSVTTTAGNDPVVTRQRQLSSGGFQVTMQESEARGGHAIERVDWIAITPGAHTLGTGKLEARRDVTANGGWKSATWNTSFTSEPCVIGSISSFNGSDTVGLRSRNASASGIQLKAQEEQSKDNETGHANETLSLVAMDCN